MCARVRLPGRFARNRKQRAPTGRKSIDRRAITSDIDRRERLLQLVAIQLTQTELGGLGAQSAKKRPFSQTHSYGPQRRLCQAKYDSPVYLGYWKTRQCMMILKKPERRGRRPGRQYTAPWLAALLSARCGRHAKNSGTPFKLQRTGTWRCSPVNSRSSS